MKKRKLGTSDLDISEVGLGCMSLGTEKNKALSILDEAIEPWHQLFGHSGFV